MMKDDRTLKISQHRFYLFIVTLVEATSLLQDHSAQQKNSSAGERTIHYRCP